jgi:hypothetical protein
VDVIYWNEWTYSLLVYVLSPRWRYSPVSIQNHFLQITLCWLKIWCDPSSSSPPPPLSLSLRSKDVIKQETVKQRTARFDSIKARQTQSEKANKLFPFFPHSFISFALSILLPVRSQFNLASKQIDLCVLNPSLTWSHVSFWRRQ